MEKSQWGSKIGFILASAGSAIGLGAVWKFPYMTAANGGGSFLLVFLIATLLIGWLNLLLDVQLVSLPLRPLENLVAVAFMMGLVGSVPLPCSSSSPSTVSSVVGS